MTECQGCGAWNDASRAVCVLCGTPLAAIDEWDASATPPPLPPLPDGGLATAMPSWLREPPSSRPLSPAMATEPTLAPPELAPASLPPLGPHADPRTFLSDDDFPHWLRDLAARQTTEPKPAAATAVPGIVTTIPTPPPWPDWPAATATALSSEAPTPATPPLAGPLSPPPEPPAASVASPRAEARREQPLWVVLLLVLLFLGVAAAALWALISNGVLG